MVIFLPQLLSPQGARNWRPSSEITTGLQQASDIALEEDFTEVIDEHTDSEDESNDDDFTIKLFT